MYSLHPNNKEIYPFRMGSDWLHLLGQCGSYFTCIHHGGRWYAILDERMTTHYHDINDDGQRELVIDKEYPAIICTCGFDVTEEEAMVMARIARNYAAIQRTVPDPTEEERNLPFAVPEYLRPFPQKIRHDWIEHYELFAEWSEQSQGFKVF